jgi:hypothetical protein
MPDNIITSVYLFFVLSGLSIVAMIVSGWVQPAFIRIRRRIAIIIAWYAYPDVYKRYLYEWKK